MLFLLVSIFFGVVQAAEEPSGIRPSLPDGYTSYYDYFQANKDRFPEYYQELLDRAPRVRFDEYMRNAAPGLRSENFRGSGRTLDDLVDFDEAVYLLDEAAGWAVLEDGSNHDGRTPRGGDRTAPRDPEGTQAAPRRGDEAPSLRGEHDDAAHAAHGFAPGSSLASKIEPGSTAAKLKGKAPSAAPPSDLSKAFDGRRNTAADISGAALMGPEEMALSGIWRHLSGRWNAIAPQLNDQERRAFDRWSSLDPYLMAAALAGCLSEDESPKKSLGLIQKKNDRELAQIARCALTTLEKNKAALGRLADNGPDKATMAAQRAAGRRALYTPVAVAQQRGAAGVSSGELPASGVESALTGLAESPIPRPLKRYALSALAAENRRLARQNMTELADQANRLLTRLKEESAKNPRARRTIDGLLKDLEKIRTLSDPQKKFQEQQAWIARARKQLEQGDTGFAAQGRELMRRLEKNEKAYHQALKRLLSLDSYRELASKNPEMPNYLVFYLEDPSKLSGFSNLKPRERETAKAAMEALKTNGGARRLLEQLSGAFGEFRKAGIEFEAFFEANSDLTGFYLLFERYRTAQRRYLQNVLLAGGPADRNKDEWIYLGDDGLERVRLGRRYGAFGVELRSATGYTRFLSADGRIVAAPQKDEQGWHAVVRRFDRWGYLRAESIPERGIKRTFGYDRRGLLAEKRETNPEGASHSIFERNRRGRIELEARQDFDVNGQFAAQLELDHRNNKGVNARFAPYRGMRMEVSHFDSKTGAESRRYLITQEGAIWEGRWIAAGGDVVPVAVDELKPDGTMSRIATRFNKNGSTQEIESQKPDGAETRSIIERDNNGALLSEHSRRYDKAGRLLDEQEVDFRHKEVIRAAWGPGKVFRVDVIRRGFDGNIVRQYTVDGAGRALVPLGQGLKGYVSYGSALDYDRQGDTAGRLGLNVDLENLIKLRDQPGKLKDESLRVAQAVVAASKMPDPEKYAPMLADWLYDQTTLPDPDRLRLEIDYGRGSVQSIGFPIKLFETQIDANGVEWRNLRVARFEQGTPWGGGFFKPKSQQITLSVLEPLKFDKNGKPENQAGLKRAFEYTADGSKRVHEGGSTHESSFWTGGEATDYMALREKVRGTDGRWQDSGRFEIVHIRTRETHGSFWGEYAKNLAELPVVEQFVDAASWVSKSAFHGLSADMQWTMCDPAARDNDYCFASLAAAYRAPVYRAIHDDQWFIDQINANKNIKNVLDIEVKKKRLESLREEGFTEETMGFAAYRAFINEQESRPVTDKERLAVLSGLYSPQHYVELGSQVDGFEGGLIKSIGVFGIVGEQAADFAVMMAPLKGLGMLSRAKPLWGASESAALRWAGQAIPKAASVTELAIAAPLAGMGAAGSVDNAVTLGKAIQRHDTAAAWGAGVGMAFDALTSGTAAKIARRAVSKFHRKEPAPLPETVEVPRHEEVKPDQSPDPADQFKENYENYRKELLDSSKIGSSSGFYINPDGSAWIQYFPGKPQTSLLQGIKFHVSASPENALAVGRAIGAYLRTEGILHKFPDPKILSTIFGKEGTQRGKFITVYPDSPAHAQKLMAEIDRILVERGLTNGDESILPPDFHYGKSGLLTWRIGQISGEPNVPGAAHVYDTNGAKISGRVRDHYLRDREGRVILDGEGRPVKDSRADPMANLQAMLKAGYFNPDELRLIFNELGASSALLPKASGADFDPGLRQQLEKMPPDCFRANFVDLFKGRHEHLLEIAVQNPDLRLAVVRDVLGESHSAIDLRVRGGTKTTTESSDRHEPASIELRIIDDSDPVAQQAETADGGLVWVKDLSGKKIPIEQEIVPTQAAHEAAKGLSVIEVPWAREHLVGGEPRLILEHLPRKSGAKSEFLANYNSKKRKWETPDIKMTGHEWQAFRREYDRLLDRGVVHGDLIQNLLVWRENGKLKIGLIDWEKGWTREKNPDEFEKTKTKDMKTLDELEQDFFPVQSTGGHGSQKTAGVIDESRRVLLPSEQPLAQYLKDQGHHIATIAEGTGPGRFADVLLDGEPAELKQLASGAVSTTVRNAVRRSLDRGAQAPGIVIDARKSGLDKEEAVRGCARVAGYLAFRVRQGHPPRLDRLRIVGDDYDLTADFASSAPNFSAACPR